MSTDTIKRALTSQLPNNKRPQVVDAGMPQQPAAVLRPSSTLASVDASAEPGMSYGQQMASVGSALASGAGTIAKTIFGADGHGLGALTGVSALPASVSALAPASVGGGRGTVNPNPAMPAYDAIGGGRGGTNPPLASQTGDARPDLANTPNLGGSTGTAVDGAAGVRKFVTPDGRTLYSNVTGSDNDMLMSSHPGVLTAPAVTAMPSSASGQSVAQLQAAYDQPGVMSNGTGAIILPGTTLSSAARERFLSTPSLSTSGSGSISGREAARLANASQIAADQVAATREGNQLTAGSSRYATEGGMSNAVTAAAAHVAGSNISAGAARYHADQALAGVKADITERATQFAATPRAIGQHMQMVNGLPTTMTTYGMQSGQEPLTPINSTPEKPAPAEGATGKLKDGRKFKIVNGQPAVVQ